MKKLLRALANRCDLDIVRMGKIKKDYGFYDHFSHESLRQKRFYNIGAGKFAHQYWTNVDYANESYRVVQRHPFLQYDLMAQCPLPIESDVAEAVYSSHVIEHVTDDAVRNMLAESYRILKPGGVIRLTAPDALLIFKAYQHGDRNFWDWFHLHFLHDALNMRYKCPPEKASIHQLFLHLFATQLSEIGLDDSAPQKCSDAEIIEVMSAHPAVETLDYFTRRCRFNPDHTRNHLNWWTCEKLIAFLKEAGFSNPYRSGWGQSLCPPMRNNALFDNTIPIMSLYVEAVK